MAKQGILTIQTAQDGVADALRAEITRGRIGPGAALRQEELAERFGVSRIPVREALRRLESEGLVTVFPNRGAFVPELSGAEIEEITGMRVLLEGDLAYRAASLAGGADIDRIGTALAVAERLSGTEEWVGADREFHRRLYDPANRPRQVATVFNLRSAVEGYGALYRKLPERRPRWLRDHRKVLDAFTRHDPDGARELVAAHVQAAGDFLVRQHGRGRPG